MILGWLYFCVLVILPCSSGVVPKLGVTCDILIVAVSDIGCQQSDINNIERSLKRCFVWIVIAFFKAKSPAGSAQYQNCLYFCHADLTTNL